MINSSRCLIRTSRFLTKGIFETHLSNHAIPCAVDLFPMLPIGHQVEIVGEFYRLCNLFEDVYTEALATAFNVDP